MEVESWGIEKRGFGRRDRKVGEVRIWRDLRMGDRVWGVEIARWGGIDCVSNETRGVRGGVRSRCMCFGETCFDVIDRRTLL